MISFLGIGRFILRPLVSQYRILNVSVGQKTSSDTFI